MQPNNKDRTEELKVLVDEIFEIQNVIRNCSNIIASVSNDYIRQTYIDDVKPYIQDHKNLTARVKSVLEEQFVYEKEIKLYNLSHHRFYRQITKDERK